MANITTKSIIIHLFIVTRFFQFFFVCEKFDATLIY